MANTTGIRSGHLLEGIFATCFQYMHAFAGCLQKSIKVLPEKCLESKRFVSGFLILMLAGCN